MANISEELKNRLLALFEPLRERYMQFALLHKTDAKKITFPIMLDGVIDRLVYNVEEKCFERLEVAVTDDGVLRRDGCETGVYCDDFDVVHISLR